MSGLYTEYQYRDGRQRHSHSYPAPAIRRCLAQLPQHARVLDIGCGNGALTAAWAFSAWEIQGIDLSESGIRQARANYPQFRFEVCGVGSRSVETFGRNTFDAVVSAEVVEHLYLPRDLVSCAFELLAPGGMFVVTTPYHGYLKNVALALSGHMDTHWTPLWDGGHIKCWSPKTLGSLLSKGGFIGQECRGAGRLPLLWKSMVISCRKPTDC